MRFKQGVRVRLARQLTQLSSAELDGGRRERATEAGRPVKEAAL